jgi:beta-glucosidase
MKSTLTLLTALFFAPLAALLAAEAPNPTAAPSRNAPQVLDASHPVEARVADLLSRMTLEEKVAQFRGAWPASFGSYRKVGDNAEITDDYKKILDGVGIGLFGSPLRADPWSGVTLEKGLSRRQGAEFVNTLQQYLRDHTRLRIPGFVSDDGHHGQHGIGATIFPQLCGMGATWNPALQKEIARAFAAEARGQGVTINFAPNLDVIRDPRFGRSDQNYGEDPWHVSVMGQAVVRGLQGESLNTDHTLVAMLRAYPGCGDVDGGHDFTGFSRGPIDLHEVVLRPWRDAIRAGAEGVMVEMSEIDAVTVAGSSHYLTELLRNRWGFKGVAMDDNFAIKRLMDVKVAADITQAAAMSVKAGMDLALSDTSTNIFRLGLPEALKQGLVSMTDIDRAVARNLRLKFLLGLFENPFVDPARAAAVARCPEHRQLALQAARESIVLLKNERSSLPLGRNLRAVAVVGPNADDNWNQLGDYAATHRREDVVTVLDGIRAKADKLGLQVNYARGCGIRTMTREGFAEALDAARRSDVIVAVVGGSSKLDFPKPGGGGRGDRSPEADTGEGVTRATLDLLGVQEDLLKELKATGKPLVVVLIHGRTMTVNWIAANADAVVDAWFPGEVGGTAVADVLFGDYNPGGKLAVSVPKHVGQLPVYYYRKYPGRKFVEMDGEPLYAFGFGLSYTTFAYSDLRVEPKQIAKGGRAEVSVNVTNTGQVAGDEVVQLYLRDQIASVVRPPRELKGFERIHLAPGQTKQVTFQVGDAELCFVNADVQWVVEPGDFEVMIGRSSSDIVLKGKLTLR